MNRFCRNNGCRWPGKGLLAGLLVLFVANLCSAMIHISVADYGANGADGKDDSAAFQAALDALYASNPKGGYLYIPNGTYDFNSRVSKYASSTWDLTIQGQSRTGVVLRCNNTLGVLQITNKARGEHITLRDVTFKANIAGAGTAYESSAPLGGTPAERMEQVFNVDVTYANTNCYFNNGINIYAANRPLVDGCTISSPTNADMSDTSINFRMQKAINLEGSYNAVVRNTVISGADTAVWVAMISNSTEGGTCMNVHADHVKTGFVFSIVINGRAGLEIRDCDITARDFGIKFYNRIIYFIAENTFRQLSPAYPLEDIRLETAPFGVVVRNTFAGPLAGGRRNVTLDSLCHDVIIGQNTLSGAVADAVTAQTGASDIVITGNNDVTGPAFTTNSFAKADATAGYAYSGSISNAAGDADGDALTFCKAGGPAWLTVNLDGTLSGIPGTNDVGTNVLTVRVMDDGGLHADATLTIPVAVQPPGLPVWPGSATFESISNEDGVVTESAQGSGVGGSTQTTTSGPGGLRLGDAAPNTQFRSFVSFDTTTLPGDATVTSATLKLKRSTVVGTDAFTWGGAAHVDIKAGNGFSGSTALQASDFEAAADATNVATMSYPAANGDWSVGTLNTNSLQYVDKTGRTQLRVYMTTATDTNGAVDYMGLWPGDATTQTNRPVFEVGYLRPNHAPAWNANPFAKADATEAAAYGGSIAADAADPDAGDTLSFSKVSGPAWLTVATNGTLSGTPANGNVGANTFVVRARDSYGAAGDGSLNITVINVNNAPTWNADPFAKSDANEGAAYSDSIAADTSDIDVGDTLTFSKISGPAWLTVAANGALSGTPLHANVGTNAFVVRVTDALGLWAEATMNITVIAANHAPVANDQSLTVAGDTATNLVLTATDADTTNLMYAILANPAHGTLSGLDPNGGAVTYLPGKYYHGPDIFTFTASDGSLYATGTVSLTVTASVTTNTGTPLWWLAQYGLTNFNADALADADGDGMPTWQEYIAGTDPTNPASKLQFTGGSMSPQGFIIHWSSVSNRFYNLNWATNLLVPFAIVPGASNLAATPPENLFTNPGPDGAAAFYWVNVHR